MTNVVSIESLQPDVLPPQWRRPARSGVELAGDYVAWGRSWGGKGGRGWATLHGDNVRRQLSFWIAALDLRSAAEFDGCLMRAERALAELKGPKSGQMSLEYGSSDTNVGPKTRLAETTIRAYAGALKAFCAWLVTRGILTANPVERITMPAKRESDGAPDKRALRVEEVRKLLGSVALKRRRLYELGLVSGLRANELRSVQQTDLSRDGSAVRLSRVWTKNRRETTQPLPARIAESLRAFGLPAVPRQPARTLQSDLARIGIAFNNGGEGKLCFHSLRATFSTLLDQCGATPRENQALMRHASKSITAELYTKTFGERLAMLVEAVYETIQPRACDQEKMLWD